MDYLILDAYTIYNSLLGVKTICRLDDSFMS